MKHTSKEFPYSFEVKDGKYTTVWNPNFVFDLATVQGLGTDHDGLEIFLANIDSKTTKAQKQEAIAKCLIEFRRINNAKTF